MLKRFILSTPLVREFVMFFWKIYKDLILYSKTKKNLKSVINVSNKIFYLGVPAHTNLGDLAQGVCIRRWLKKHYPQKIVVEIETNALVNTHFSSLKLLKKSFLPSDIIVFQSGYTTTDLGGYADEMHRAVMELLPNAKMLMLPQTIFFENPQNRKRTAECYNKMKNMLFLARDNISYEMAREMFPDILVMPYPDIVTTLIGQKKYENDRDGIMFCCRNDGEKFYSDAEIDALMAKCRSFCSVSKTDTTKIGKTADIVKNAKSYIENEIEEYSKYKLIITDRYHGTILSLVAGTPVIIIKTTDHKVTTGADWFKGVYDSHVYLANDLNDAYEKAAQVLNQNIDYSLEPFFEREYYDKLPSIFERMN
ncbi:MAG: polysaccharide pyruvyl transferase family protein [Clostridia bacterium]|nr:polysaccharide pyruvyl transferase family protein [Clostridia bacterium]